jgi:hypothetical protein
MNLVDVLDFRRRDVGVTRRLRVGVPESTRNTTTQWHSVCSDPASAQCAEEASQSEEEVNLDKKDFAGLRNAIFPAISRDDCRRRDAVGRLQLCLSND